MGGKIPSDFKFSSSREVCIGSIPPRTKRIMEFLDALPYKELLTSRELVNRMGLPSYAISDSGILMQDYREKVGMFFVYGSKKTIAELRRRMSNENR